MGRRTLGARYLKPAMLAAAVLAVAPAGAPLDARTAASAAAKKVGDPQNPIIRDIFTADPSAHVWADGRLYVYPSHDVSPPKGCDLMDKYHVYSTDDMVHWVDHGQILQASDVPWGRTEGGFMWAPDIAYRNGTYYLYFPHPSGTEWNKTWKIGVATSSQPASGFKVQGYIKGLDSLIDPTVFVDDDGKAYFYYGGGGQPKGGRLKDNMMEIDGQMQDMKGLADFHEASWVHKRNGLYYLSYSDNYDKDGAHNRMRYATSKSPLGPWTYRGIYMDSTDSFTNHGSIVQYKGQWYSFYHTSMLSGNDWLRSVSVDKLYYNPDGTIKLVRPTKVHGTPHGGRPHAVPGRIEAEDYDDGGQPAAYSDSSPANEGGAYRPGEGVDVGALAGGGYHIGWTNSTEWTEYTVRVARSGAYTVSARVATPEAGGSALRILADGLKVGMVMVPNSGGGQRYVTASAKMRLSAGVHVLQVHFAGNLNLDYLDVR